MSVLEHMRVARPFRIANVKPFFPSIILSSIAVILIPLYRANPMRVKLFSICGVESIGLLYSAIVIVAPVILSVFNASILDEYKNEWKRIVGFSYTMEPQLDKITEKEILNKIADAKRIPARDPKRDVIRIHGTQGFAIIYPPKNLNLPKKFSLLQKSEAPRFENRGFFFLRGAESHTENLPHDTRPVYDPTQILIKNPPKKEPKNQLWQKMIQKKHRFHRKLSRESQSRIAERPLLCSLPHSNGGAELGTNLILVTGTAPSVRRTISKLEVAMNRIERSDLFNQYAGLYGLPETLGTAVFLCEQLEQGYREIWRYMNKKAVGPAYMVQQPTSEPWFKNRIRPI
jgi:hypothetical protein